MSSLTIPDGCINPADMHLPPSSVDEAPAPQAPMAPAYLATPASASAVFSFSHADMHLPPSSVDEAPAPQAPMAPAYLAMPASASAVSPFSPADLPMPWPWFFDPSGAAVAPLFPDDAFQFLMPLFDAPTAAMPSFPLAMLAPEEASALALPAPATSVSTPRAHQNSSRAGRAPRTARTASDSARSRHAPAPAPAPAPSQVGPSSQPAQNAPSTSAAASSAMPSQFSALGPSAFSYTSASLDRGAASSSTPTPVPVAPSATSSGQLTPSHRMELNAAKALVATVDSDASGHYPCPVPGCDTVFTSRFALKRHLTAYDVPCPQGCIDRHGVPKMVGRGSDPETMRRHIALYCTKTPKATRLQNNAAGKAKKQASDAAKVSSSTDTGEGSRPAKRRRRL